MDADLKAYLEGMESRIAARIDAMAQCISSEFAAFTDRLVNEGGGNSALAKEARRQKSAKKLADDKLRAQHLEALKIVNARRRAGKKEG